MTIPRSSAGLGGGETHQVPRRYRDALLLLLAAAGVGALVAFLAGHALLSKPLRDTALAVAVAAGMLGGVLVADGQRRQAAKGSAPKAKDVVETREPTPPATSTVEEGGDEPAASRRSMKNLLPSLAEVGRRVRRELDALDLVDRIRVGLGGAGIIVATLILSRTEFPARLEWNDAAMVAAVCVGAAIFAAAAARYLSEIPAVDLPEAAGLTRGARLIAWMFLLAAVSIGAQSTQQLAALRVLHFIILAIVAWTCYGLIAADGRENGFARLFPVDVGPIPTLGSRANILASLLDAGERQLGIDLRSTWALTIARRSIEPLAIGLAFVGWLSTAITVVAVDEQGLVERFGVPVSDVPLDAGLHIHWPWPVDRVYRVPVRRAQAIGVGHEGEEAPGPENVLWSVEHAANEFTLVLGNGRDLITVDAAVQYRVTNPRAWRYGSQNPEVALKALAYRAVMRNTVNRTLTDALSENVALLTTRMRGMVQADADSLGLGVTVIGFTVGGMHPPVAVSPAYEGVVSAQIRRATAIIDAQVYRNQALPNAQAAVLIGTNGAQEETAEALGRAAGEAWSFRVLEAQYRASPAEYMFRRRLETLEKGLTGRPFTVVDSRFLRDGGELWVTP